MRSMGMFVVFALSHLASADQKIADFWYAGAEVSSFELKQSRYGKSHPGHAELIFVTEPFLLDKQVKNESGKARSTDVLKLNALTTFNTGLYSYRTMTSTFRPIDWKKFPHALKSTTSVQDWCGQAFQQCNRRNGKWSVEVRSYFEKVADKNFSLPDAYLEDALWITLRLDPRALPTGRTLVVPGSLFTRFKNRPMRIQNADASLTHKGDETVYLLRYESLGRSLAIHFDTAFPHVIRKWTEITPDGTTEAKLKKRLMNVDYWNLNDPSDASKRRELGLEPEAD